MKQQETPVGTAITDNISALADGSVSLCVAGRNGINQWQVRTDRHPVDKRYNAADYFQREVWGDDGAADDE